MKDYTMIHLIEVHHQTGCRYYTSEDLVGTALNAGLTYQEYADFAAADEEYAGEVPAELARLLKDGPVVAVMYDDSDYVAYVPAAQFSAEDAALGFLAEDLSALIIIRNAEDAIFYAEKYKGHEAAAVRSLAQGIFEDNGDWVVRDREAGNVIDHYTSKYLAECALEDFEEGDRAEGTFTEDFYEVVCLDLED